MKLQEYYKAINEQLAPHNLGIMLCVAAQLFKKDYSVNEVAEFMINNPM